MPHKSFTVIPQFTSQLVPKKKKGDVNRLRKGNKKFDDVNRNKVNRDDLNQRITVLCLNLWSELVNIV